MQFADGMEEALKVGDGFASESEAAAFWSEGAAEADTEEHSYVGGGGQTQRLRVYRGGDELAPTLLYIHGGGWVGGSIDLNEWCARGLAHGAQCNVVSISYRLAPEHPYPAALMDCLAALKWVQTNGGALQLNAARICVGGASAGANLAIATALASEPDIFLGMVLFYGVLGGNFNTSSYLQYAEGPGLTRQRMQGLFDSYDPEKRRVFDPLITPQLAKNLNELPPACLIAAEHDVLRDDSVNMAAALKEAGVRTDFHIEPGVTHGFINRGRLVPSTNNSIARAARFVSELSELED